jgi:hypothetical protein
MCEAVLDFICRHNGQAECCYLASPLIHKRESFIFLGIKRLSQWQNYSGNDSNSDRLCGPVVRVPGYRSRGPGRFPTLPDYLRSTGSEQGPLSLVSTIEELLRRNGSGSGLENREYGHRGYCALSALHPSMRKSWHKLRPTSCCRSVGIVWTQATEFVCL